MGLQSGERCHRLGTHRAMLACLRSPFGRGLGFRALSEQQHARNGDLTNAFGREFCRTQFMLDPAYVNLNHGSFGATPRAVHARRIEAMQRMEARPDVFIRGEMYDLIQRSRESLSRLVGANVENLVLVENASAGVHAVVRSLRLQPGDIVVYMRHAYPMVGNLFAHMETTDRIRRVEVSVPFPLDDGQALLDALMRSLAPLDGAARSRIRLLALSGMTSMPAFVEPVEEMIGAFRSVAPEAHVLVDGAHMVGQMEMDVRASGADFIISTPHKWLYAPKAGAFLWCSPRVLERSPPHPLVYSLLNPPGTPFVERFQYTGTRDATAFAGVDDALAWRESHGGEEAFRRYSNALARAAGDLFVDALSTRRVVPASLEHAMTSVVLPTRKASVAKVMAKSLLTKHAMYVAVGSDGDVHYLRLSAPVYLELSDFAHAAELVREELARAEAMSERERHDALQGPYLWNGPQLRF